jgi:predicted PurR-regulated permease PerM
MSNQTTADPDTVNRAGRARTDGFAFARRVLVAVAVIVFVGLLLALVWYAADLLMLVFAGVLVSILLRRLTSLVRRVTKLGHSLSLALVIVALAGVIAAFGWVVADRLATEASELIDQLRAAVDTVRERLAGYQWAQQWVGRLPSLSELFADRGGLLSRLSGVAATTMGALSGGLVVIVVGIYVASQPELYSSGIRHLLPLGARPRAGQVIDAVDEALGRWLLGRFGLMVINGTLTAVALSVLGVPLALMLGAIAGLLNFIPNFGPFIAAVPAIVLALAQGPQTALYTTVVYLVVQMVDGYILTPLVDRKSVELPPVVTLSAQLLLGIMFGFIGLVVASPVAAAVMIVVEMVYVEDVLGDVVTPSRGSRATSSQADHG